MTIHRPVSVGMINQNKQTVFRMETRFRHGSATRGADGGSPGNRDVDAGMGPKPFSCDREQALKA